MKRRVCVFTLASLLAVGCSNGPIESADTEFSSTISIETISTSTTQRAGDQFTSSVYPYAISWPDGELETEWRPATEPWDGTSRIDHGNAYTDYVRTADGDLFAFGYPTSVTSEALADLVAQQAEEWHSCAPEPEQEQSLSAGGTDGILATYVCSGRTVIRWVGVHDGFGLAIVMLTAPSGEIDSVMANFEERVGQLAWTS